ncbi:MAG: beta-ketoacyl synthase N-terminal-like domain-containing protein, partial [Myxococcota bacterium]|nr:beta-ketoacyl synthase N-terminal-like domain-containing protein [Myxococcota bacterium]
MSNDIVFLSGKRTPFGTFSGVFTDLSALDLGVLAGTAAIEQAGVAATDVDHVIFGNVMQTSPDAIYGARHIGLRCGVPIEVPALTVNRLCGSGFEALVQGAHMLRLGLANVVLAGGAENMTQSPHTIRGARKGFRLGGTKMNDYLQEVLLDPQAGCTMAITAENLAEKYGITREDADDYGYRSQTAWVRANEEGCFAQEMVPVTLKSRRGDRVVDTDEHPQLSPLQAERIRSRFSREAMAKLRPVFKENGTVTAANASGINDGAGAMVMTTASLAEQRGLAPIGRML